VFSVTLVVLDDDALKLIGNISPKALAKIEVGGDEQ
jgi:hypothetical protein